MKNLNPLLFALLICTSCAGWVLFALDKGIFMQEEIWKDIKGQEGLYQISNLGRVKSLPKLTLQNGKYPYISKEKFRKPQLSKRGYLLVSYGRNNNRHHESLHRLIAKSFIPNPNNYPEVNHKNGIKTDNRIENLEWCTLHHNIQHSVDTGLHVSGTRCANSIFTESQVLEILRIYRSKEMGYRKLAKLFNTSQSNIRSICIGISWNKVTGIPRHHTQKRIIKLNS